MSLVTLEMIWEVARSKAGANITCPTSKELILCSKGVSFAVFQALLAPRASDTPIDHYLGITGVEEKAAPI